MNFNLLDTDRNYLHMSDGFYFDPQPWLTSENPFVRRMSMNLQLGTKLTGFSTAALNDLLSTAMTQRDEAITLDIQRGETGDFEVEVIGVFDFYIAPAESDTAANLAMALAKTGESRPQFIVTVAPDARFWIHSEQALASGIEDWASIWQAERGV
ncbi:TPA: hypothetical protein NIB55_005492 [Pseudomonas aeruginosa]|nr:hypothetical protein [Pseudomonas aeruginosa]